jgi:hypothetical protein
VVLGAAVTFAVMLPLGVARASYIGRFAMLVTMAGLLPSLGRAILARRRQGVATAAPDAESTAKPGPGDPPTAVAEPGAPA